LYKELIVWQKSMEFVDWVYAILKSFPKTENYRLSDQLARAVISIPSNIAEGMAVIRKAILQDSCQSPEVHCMKL